MVVQVAQGEVDVERQQGRELGRCVQTAQVVVVGDGGVALTSFAETALV
jgi:hypothetical protein